MLLWIGGILCFVAYGIQAASTEEPQDDNVSPKISYYSPCVIYPKGFCSEHILLRGRSPLFMNIPVFSSKNIRVISCISCPIHSFFLLYSLLCILQTTYATNTALSRNRARSCRCRHWNLLLLPGIQEFQDHGIL